GCDVIVDDVSYSDEGAFQDGLVALAVNDAVVDGALYFSAAANSGNISSGTSGTWEGDFQNGGDAGIVLDTLEGTVASIHNFGSESTPISYDALTVTTPFAITLQWSDPLARSTNDYDLFVLNNTGTAVKAFSASRQTGTQDPIEE